VVPGNGFEKAARQSKRSVALYLRAVHQPPGVRIELVAAMQDAAVVPQHEIAYPPLLIPGQFRTGCVRPKRIEQPLAVFELEAFDAGIAPAPEEQCLAPGHGVGADDRVVSARSLPRVRYLAKPTAQLAGTVVGCVVPAEPPFDPAPQLVGQSLVGAIHVGKAGVAA
jgi:hypothetical protein